MSAQVIDYPYPRDWSTLQVRNATGRAFWFVCRHFKRNELEYVNDIDGTPRCFRLQKQACAAIRELRQEA